MDCVKMELENIDASLHALAIDIWVDNNLSECSVCTYYEEVGTLEERLTMAIFNETVVVACTKMIEADADSTSM